MITEERFLKKVFKTESCWIWIGSKNEDGYGSFYFNKKIGRAHRYSFSIYKTVIPKGMVVLHSCDNPGCVNPDHLFLGTIKDNVHDCEKKGRGRHPKGENCGASKLTEEQAKEIKSLKGTPLKEILARFPIKKSNVYSIQSGNTWKHL